MAFVNALSATASVTLQRSKEEAVTKFINRFKTACQERSGKGFFSAEGTYGFTIDKADGRNPNPYQHANANNIIIKECVYNDRNAFKTALDTELTGLGFKDATVTITWPDSGALQPYYALNNGYGHRMDGSVKIKATWPSKPSSEPRVKRERDDASPATSGRVALRRRM